MQDISRHIGTALRWLPLVVLVALAAGLGAYVWSSSRPVEVEATGTLRVDPGRNPSPGDRSDAVLAAVGYASEMEAPGFATAVINELGLDETADELQRRFSTKVDSSADIGIIQFGVRSTDPQEAQRIARAFGSTLIQKKTSELYSADVKNATQQVNKLEENLSLLRRQLQVLQNKANKNADDRALMAGIVSDIAALNVSIENLRPYTQAYVRNLPAWVVEPRLPSRSLMGGPLYWTLLAMVAGAMMALILAFVIETMRTIGKVRDERDLELATGQPTLGGLIETRRAAGRSDADRLVMLHYPRSDEAAAYRGLIARIGFTGGTTRTLMVASARPTDAKSLVAANLAVAYAEAGRNVILVDADYRSPRIHKFFGLDNDRGLTTILADPNVPLGWATVPSPHPRLGLMLAGPMPRGAHEPLGSRQLNVLLRRLLQAADLVIFDSPPIEANLDASVLAEGLGETLLVVPRDTREEEIAEAAQSLQAIDAAFLGAVLYRKVRRSRRGVRSKVLPAPDGWGPTWPMLYDQPARIPAISRPAVGPAPEPRASSAGSSERMAPPVQTKMPSPPAPDQRPSGQPPGSLSDSPPRSAISAEPTAQAEPARSAPVQPTSLRSLRRAVRPQGREAPAAGPFDHSGTSALRLVHPGCPSWAEASQPERCQAQRGRPPGRDSSGACAHQRVARRAAFR